MFACQVAGGCRFYARFVEKKPRPSAASGILAIAVGVGTVLFFALVIHVPVGIVVGIVAAIAILRRDPFPADRGRRER